MIIMSKNKIYDSNNNFFFQITNRKQLLPWSATMDICYKFEPDQMFVSNHSSICICFSLVARIYCH